MDKNLPSPRKIVVAGLQAHFSRNSPENVARVTRLARQAAGQGAQVILPPELFESVYFCQTEQDENFALAREARGHPTIAHFQNLARELGTVIPVSFFERDGHAYYNSLAMIDADGVLLGIYRKSHIPDGPGYEEKFYFRPGNTGFKAWTTRFGTIGVGICWDQWFPECARAMMLLGADILLYPTAIGSEPTEPSLDTRKLWQRTMVGHAVANVVPVLASNRIGVESGQNFYGHSFLCDHRGEMIAELGSTEEGIVLGELDLETIRKNRASFGFFRDRRPDLYGPLVDR